MAVETLTIEHQVDPETFIQVEALFDRRDGSKEIERIIKIDPTTKTEITDLTSILLQFTGELQEQIERKLDQELEKVMGLIESGIYDFDE